MGIGHHLEERKLFHDICEKNTLRARLECRLKQLDRWTDTMVAARRKRTRKHFLKTIQRLFREVEVLGPEVVHHSKDLISRIQAELKCSEEEVKRFEEQYRKELAEAQEAERKMQEAAKRTSLQSSNKALELYRALKRAERKLLAEKADVVKVQQELSSEAKDRPILQRELARAVGEVQAFTL